MTNDIQTPFHHHRTLDFSGGEGERLAFWKQILPKKTIHYTAKDGSRQKIDFNEEYLADLAKMEGIDKIGFLLADTDNRHTMDPERWRGDVVKMEVRDDGLYGKIVFPSKEAASAVLSNPQLGVSARIREGIPMSDGTTAPRGIIHVLGTLDPQVSGMKPWETADLSTTGSDVLDLSNEEYDMAKKQKAEDYTAADIDAMTEAELDEFLDEFAPGLLDEFEEADEADEDENDDTDEDEDESESEDTNDEDEAKNLVGAGADMSKVQKDIDLANQRAEYAAAQVTDLSRELAVAKWEKERDAYLSAGVPAALLDLAAPLLTRRDDAVLDLSNEGGASDVNASQIVRGLLDSAKGTLDLSRERGHSGTFATGDGDTDDAMLAAWDKQSY